MRLFGTMRLVLFCFVITVSCVFGSKHEKYKGWSVVSIQPSDDTENSLLAELVENLDLDVWQHPTPGKRAAHVAVTPEVIRQLLENLEAFGISYEVVVPDIATTLEERDEELEAWKRSRGSRAEPFDDYPRYEEINNYLEELAERYPDLVTLETAGQSYEGRDIKYVKVSTTNFTDPSKPIYFMDSLIHAREWVTAPVVLYVLHRLLDERRPEDADLLENVDWVVWPTVNPDGYEYTHTDERLWRRTRSFNPNVSTTCYGVDANRNFDVGPWASVGVSANPCSDVYPGSEAFSEIEIKLLSDYLLGLGDRVQLYLNVHSYGNYVLIAYGNGSLPVDPIRVHAGAAIFGAAVDAVKLPKAQYYLIGSSAFVLYPSSGTARDYGQSIGIPLSYTLELPGYEYLFQVPPQYIGQINRETFQGIAASARYAIRLYAERLQV